MKIYRVTTHSNIVDVKGDRFETDQSGVHVFDGAGVITASFSAGAWHSIVTVDPDLDPCAQATQVAATGAPS